MNRKLMRNIDGQIDLEEIFEITKDGVVNFAKLPTVADEDLKPATGALTADGGANIKRYIEGGTTTNEVDVIAFNIDHVNGKKIITFPDLEGIMAILQTISEITGEITDILTKVNHGLKDNDYIQVIDKGTSVNLINNNYYYVKKLSNDTFKLKSTKDDSTIINITAPSEGTIISKIALPINQGGTGLSTIPINTLVFGNGTDPLQILEPNNETYDNKAGPNKLAGKTSEAMVKFLASSNGNAPVWQEINIGHILGLSKDLGTYDLVNIKDSIDKKHSQNSDTGTSVSSFILNSGSNNKVTLDASTAGKLVVKDKDGNPTGLKIKSLEIDNGYSKDSEGIIWGTVTSTSASNYYTLDFITSKLFTLVAGCTISFKLSSLFANGTYGVKIKLNTTSNGVTTIVTKTVKYMGTSGIIDSPASKIKGMVTLRYDGTDFFSVGEGGEAKLIAGIHMTANSGSSNLPEKAIDLGVVTALTPKVMPYNTYNGVWQYTYKLYFSKYNKNFLSHIYVYRSTPYTRCEFYYNGSAIVNQNVSLETGPSYNQVDYTDFLYMYKNKMLVRSTNYTGCTFIFDLLTQGSLDMIRADTLYEGSDSVADCIVYDSNNRNNVRMFVLRATSTGAFSDMWGTKRPAQVSYYFDFVKLNLDSNTELLSEMKLTSKTWDHTTLNPTEGTSEWNVDFMRAFYKYYLNKTVNYVDYNVGRAAPSLFVHPYNSEYIISSSSTDIYVTEIPIVSVNTNVTLGTVNSQYIGSFTWASANPLFAYNDSVTVNSPSISSITTSINSVVNNNNGTYTYQYISPYYYGADGTILSNVGITKNTNIINEKAKFTHGKSGAGSIEVMGNKLLLFAGNTIHIYNVNNVYDNTNSFTFIKTVYLGAPTTQINQIDGKFIFICGNIIYDENANIIVRYPSTIRIQMEYGTNTGILISTSQNSYTWTSSGNVNTEYYPTYSLYTTPFVLPEFKIFD